MGSVLVLIQFDVCEEFQLEKLQQSVNARTLAKPVTKQAAPAYVRYQRPPVIGPLEPLQLESGEQLKGEIKYYDYGVVSLIFRYILWRLGSARTAGQSLGMGSRFRSARANRPPKAQRVSGRW